jgi:uncharacterized protein (TIGR02679 family)
VAVTIDRQRLVRLLGTDELAWLVERVRLRLELGRPLDVSVTLAESTAGQRAAVHRLLGRRQQSGRALTVPLPAVDDVLRRSGACPEGLAAAVILLAGDVTERSVAAATAERAWSEAVAEIVAAVAARPELRPWWERLQATGLLRRLAGAPETAATLSAQLAEAIRRLPADGVPVGRFAADLTGDSHALDDDRPLSTLVLSLARALTGGPDGTGIAWRREVLASVGLLRDDLSTTVLSLGLPGDTATATGRALGEMGRAGQPMVLTMRQLVRDPPMPDLRGRTVSVAENPVVISAAADRLGAASPALVCTNGQPSVAVLHLLRLVVTAGATLRYHGDFDWGGVRIGNVVFGRLPVLPWRFDAACYSAAVSAGIGRELAGRPVAASWDETLADRMARCRIRVDEELVLDDLLADLAETDRPR